MTVTLWGGVSCSTGQLDTLWSDGLCSTVHLDTLWGGVLCSTVLLDILCGVMGCAVQWWQIEGPMLVMCAQAIVRRA